MARNRGKKALYEVMSAARSKSEDRSRKIEEASPTSDTRSPSSDLGAGAWRKKPRIVQLNAGRIEFSVPYQVAVAAALVFVFVLLASYRLGQFGSRDGPQTPSGERTSQAGTPALTGRAATDVVSPPAPAQRTPESEKVSAGRSTAEPPVPVGDNVIVLVQYHTMADLQPVQAHFAAHNIETEIVPSNGQYLLQTKQRYVSTMPGSDGYKAIQKIKEVGALYKGKAPPGYEPFAPHYFSDAYGRKVK